MTYDPHPIDTSKVKLDEALLQLTERLAQNTHDLWARRRLSEGWSYGSQRDDPTKKHPCLVPYDQLLESEKEYDRMTAMEAIKAIITLGYRIER